MVGEEMEGGEVASEDEALERGDEEMLAQLDGLLEEAGIFVATEMDGDRLVLSGAVDSEESRQAALDVATALAEPLGVTVEDAMDVTDLSPDRPFVGRDSGEDLGGGDFAYADPDANPNAQFDPVFEMAPDFTEDIGTTDPQVAAAEAVPYFPPTDPVVRPTSDSEQLEVVGGFGGTAMDDVAGEASFDARNDDDLALAVQRELGEDALTADLPIRVGAVNGVVILRGEVPSLEDAENAEAVAARVGGVQEVREELGITGLRR